MKDCVWLEVDNTIQIVFSGKAFKRKGEKDSRIFLFYNFGPTIQERSLFLIHFWLSLKWFSGKEEIKWKIIYRRLCVLPTLWSFSKALLTFESFLEGNFASNGEWHCKDFLEKIFLFTFRPNGNDFWDLDDFLVA